MPILCKRFKHSESSALVSRRAIKQRVLARGKPLCLWDTNRPTTSRVDRATSTDVRFNAALFIVKTQSIDAVVEALKPLRAGGVLALVRNDGAVVVVFEFHEPREYMSFLRFRWMVTGYLAHKSGVVECIDGVLRLDPKDFD